MKNNTIIPMGRSPCGRLGVMSEHSVIMHLYKYDYITFEQAIAKMKGMFAHLDKGDTSRLGRFYRERFYLTHGNKNQRLIEEEHNEKEKDS